MGQPSRCLSPNLESLYEERSATPKSFIELNKEPMQRLVAEGRKKMDKSTPPSKASQYQIRYMTPKKQLTVNIPNKLKPRINKGPHRLVGKSLQPNAMQNFNKEINWGRLAAGGARYYRPTFNESAIVDSLKGYFTTPTLKDNVSHLSHLSRYQDKSPTSITKSLK